MYRGQSRSGLGVKSNHSKPRQLSGHLSLGGKQAGKGALAQRRRWLLALLRWRHGSAACGPCAQPAWGCITHPQQAAKVEGQLGQLLVGQRRTRRRCNGRTPALLLLLLKLLAHLPGGSASSQQAKQAGAAKQAGPARTEQSVRRLLDCCAGGGNRLLLLLGGSRLLLLLGCAGSAAIHACDAGQKQAEVSGPKQGIQT